MNKIVLLFFLITIFLITSYLKAEKVEIINKIGTDIITNIDIENEFKYLIALNSNYKTIEKKKIYSYAKESLIREKIKKNEILKFFELGNKDTYIDGKIREIYKNLGFTNIVEFENYLIDYNLKVSDIYKKIEIEVKWNQLIFDKYRNQITVNKDILKEKLIGESKNRETYNLSELVFSVNNRSEFEKKYNQIMESIEKIGFEKSVLIFSEASSIENSGKLGWIDEISLSKVILNEIKKINILQITNPIKISNGVLILKLNDKKKINEISKNIDEELEKLINFEKNKQLNIFSSIHFNKIKEKYL